MTTNFPIKYLGNKRTEFKEIIKYVDLNGVKTIVEPFAGTAYVSYKISTLYPKQFKYHINDLNDMTYQFYETFKDKNKCEEINKNVNKYINEYNTILEKISDEDMKNYKSFELKEYYKNKLNSYKENKDLSIFIFINKASRGFNVPNFRKVAIFDITKYGIYQFINNEDVTITKLDGVEIVDEYKDNKEALIFCDPPYLLSANDFYMNSYKNKRDTEKKIFLNIYQYFNINNINEMKAKLLIVVEDSWIIDLLFKDYQRFKYDKIYQINKTKTKHTIIINYKLD